MELIIKFNINNAIFDESTDAIIDVIKQAIRKIEGHGDSLMQGYAIPLYELNGNKVGYMQIKDGPDTIQEEDHTYDGYIDCLGHNVGYDVFDSTTENPIPLTQSDEEHIASCINKGYVEGELIVRGEDDVDHRGSRKIIR